MTRTNNRWTLADLTLLEKRYADVGNAALEKLMRGRHSVKSIQAEAHRKGLKKSAARRTVVGRANVRWGRVGQPETGKLPLKLLGEFMEAASKNERGGRKRTSGS